MTTTRVTRHTANIHTANTYKRYTRLTRIRGTRGYHGKRLTWLTWYKRYLLSDPEPGISSRLAAWISHPVEGVNSTAPVKGEGNRVGEEIDGEV